MMDKLKGSKSSWTALSAAALIGLSPTPQPGQEQLSPTFTIPVDVVKTEVVRTLGDGSQVVQKTYESPYVVDGYRRELEKWVNSQPESGKINRSVDDIEDAVDIGADAVSKILAQATDNPIKTLLMIGVLLWLRITQPKKKSNE